MVEEDCERDVDADLARLQRKSRLGALEVVGQVLEDPKVQQVIKKSVLKETYKSGLLMACLFVGLLMLMNTAKTVLQYGWQVDLVASVVLVAVGLYSLLRNIKGAS